MKWDVQESTGIDESQLRCLSGGQVGIVFSHNLFTPSAFLFSTSSGSDSELVLTYVGTPSSFSSEDTQVVLMLQVSGLKWNSKYLFKAGILWKLQINKTSVKSPQLPNLPHFQATEQRPDALITTIPLMVTVSGVPPTSTGAPETTPTTSCDKEEKYFISMVVLGACLGGLLTALVLILLCLCCKRSVSLKSVTGILHLASSQGYAACAVAQAQLTFLQLQQMCLWDNRAWWLRELPSDHSRTRWNLSQHRQPNPNTITSRHCNFGEFAIPNPKFLTKHIHKHKFN